MKLTIWILFLILIAGNLYSEDSSLELPVLDSLKVKRYTLETVRVIGQLPAQTIGAITVKTLDATVKPAPVSVKESLQDISGLSVTVGTKDESNLRIRGFRQNEVKILIDGRPLNAGYFGHVDLQNLPVSDIKTIQILKGPVSSLYGSNTMGGVVNLISKEPSTSKWGHLGMQFKRNNTNHLELSTAHSFEEWNYWVYAARDNTDGFILSDDFIPASSENGDVRNHLQKTQFNYQIRANRNLSPLHSLGCTAGFTAIDRKLIPRSIYGFGEEYRTFKDWQRYQTTLMDDLILSEQQNLKTMLWLDGGQDTYQSFQDEAHQNLILDSTLKYRTLGFNPRLEWQTGKNLKLNTGYRGEVVFSTRKDNANYPDWTPHYINLHNFFTQAEFQPFTQITFTTGMGLAAFGNDVRKELDMFPEPTAGVYIRHTDGSSVSIAAGMNTAYPTMQQLFSSDRGNPDLKAQYSTKYELSFLRPFIWKALSGALQCDLYYNDVQDLIDEGQDEYINIANSQTAGSEITLTLLPVSWWEVSASYALLKNPGSQDYRLTESPQNSAELSQTWHLPWEISCAFTSSYKDYRLSQDPGFAYKILPAYWTHNLALKKSWQDYSISLGLENITDTYYEEEYGFPAAGVNFNLGLTAEI
jgi:outer membrane receptor protein involved in Fe transport